MLCEEHPTRMQAAIFGFREDGPEDMVYYRVFARTGTSRGHNRRIVVLEPCDVQVREGDDAQGISVESQRHGSHYGQICDSVGRAVWHRRCV